MTTLAEIDKLEAVVIIDNELDPMSWIAPSTVGVTGKWVDIGLSQTIHHADRGNATEVPMEALCCGAHGLSVLLTATKDGVSHSMLFDTGPEEEAFERNATRLGVDLSTVEVIQLSHWHRDHSGGMLKAISMINEAKSSKSTTASVTVDLHPTRPFYRGFNFGGNPVSIPADPTFDEIETAGGIISRNSEPHTVLGDMFLISGYIPGVAPYETGLKNGIQFHENTGKWEKDEEMADERFLMCNLKGKGIIMFTGCSHRGVVNASKEAVNLLGGKVPLHAILGGYHLSMNDDARVKETVRDLKALDPKVLLPGHCSGWRVKFEVEKEMPGRLVPSTVGSKIVF